MTDTPPPGDDSVVTYWNQISSSWIEAVRSGGIESRVMVTNEAIMRTILDRSPRSVLDLGCGEGWLCRALSDHGIATIGVDVVPELIEKAKAAGVGDYRVVAYESIAESLDVVVDLLVCNFSLLGKESVETVFAHGHSLLAEDGCFVVQTLHPLIACGDEEYRDGWRWSSWGGISDEISDPSPWYFRTFESWVRLFCASKFKLEEIREPLHPETGRPASVIFVAALE